MNGVDKNIVHEVDFLKNVLMLDNRNEVIITIPASIRVNPYKEDEAFPHEYDGMIIYPNRKEDQVVFLEAKNGKFKYNNENAVDCLKHKLDDASIIYNPEDIIELGKDCYWYYTI